MPFVFGCCLTVSRARLGGLRGLAVAGVLLGVSLPAFTQSHPATTPKVERAADSGTSPASTDNPIKALQSLFDRLLGPVPAAPAPVAPPVVPAPVASPAAAPPQAVVAPTPAPAPAAIPATPVVSPPVAVPAVSPALPKVALVALLIPTKSALLGRAADIARQGFMAAHGMEPDKPEVKLIETDGTPEDALRGYREALAQGATVVVGPLTRGEVTALAKSGIVKVPTLLLNQPEGEYPAERLLTVFGLGVENEAREAARVAQSSSAKSAVIVTLNTPLQKRAAQSFADEWRARGGSIVDTIELAGPAAYSKLRGQLSKLEADVLFLSADAEKARLIRPSLGMRPIISTSQVFAGHSRSKKPAEGEEPVASRAFHDLNGIRFVDMPWLHQPDHAASIIYPRAEKALSGELDRLYALGIDAWRLGVLLSKRADNATDEVTLDGVTGKLTLRRSARGQLVERAPIQASFRDGMVVASP